MHGWVDVHLAPLTQAELSDAVFSGRILYFEGLAPLVAVIAETEAILTDAFAPHVPEAAHASLSPEAHEACFGAAEKSFRASAAIKRNIHVAIGAAGADLSDTFCDRLRLRASPPQDAGAGRVFHRSFTPPHRDSWGSAIRCQINWWFPVFPLHTERTLALYPAHWSVPIANNVEGWDWRSRDPAMPRAPTARGVVDKRDEVRVLIAPGAIAAFSGAHLHEGVPNATSRTRFSVETRTVNLHDLEAGRGAPAIDGLAARPAYEWFRAVADGRSLASLAPVA